MTPPLTPPPKADVGPKGRGAGGGVTPVPRCWRPQILALGALTAFAWLVWTGDSPAKMTEETSEVPEQLGLWGGTRIESDPRALEILETDDVALMEYRMGEEPPVWFARVSGFGNRAAFHPPELCYIGSHFEVLEREPISMLVHGKEHRMMRLVIGQDDDRYEAWYWFTAGDRVTPSYYQQQLWLVMDSVRRKPMSGTLVRVSTPLDDPAGTRRRLLAFVTSLDTPTPQLARHDL